MQDPEHTPAPAHGTAADTPTGPRHLTIVFTGSGSEYFRIWLVNTLLTLVTLTLYAPYAKVRRLRWQYANTLIDGQPLAFHAEPGKMLRGHVLLLIFSGLYLGAGQVSALAGAVSGALFVALWPALWHASLRFRLANSSWRGLRFAFTGSVAQAYAALAPGMVASALMLGLLAWAGLADGAEGSEPAADSAWHDSLLVLGMVASLLMLPWWSWRARRYQHSHYQWGGQTTTFDARLGSCYGLALRAGAVALLPIVVVGVVSAVALGALGLSQGGWPSSPGMLGLLMLLMGLGYVGVMLLGRAFLMSRQQNLVWNHTHSPALRFHSQLALARVWPRLTKNLVFTALTLGLYWPFGWVRLLALRLESVQIDAQEDPARWVNTLALSAGSATGEAAGDLLDVDLGL